VPPQQSRRMAMCTTRVIRADARGEFMFEPAHEFGRRLRSTGGGTRQDVLVYTSQPLAQDLEVTGQ